MAQGIGPPWPLHIAVLVAQDHFGYDVEWLQFSKLGDQMQLHRRLIVLSGSGVIRAMF